MRLLVLWPVAVLLLNLGLSAVVLWRLPRLRRPPDSAEPAPRVDREIRISDAEMVRYPWPDYRGPLLGRARFDDVVGRYYDPRTRETVFQIREAAS